MISREPNNSTARRITAGVLAGIGIVVDFWLVDRGVIKSWSRLLPAMLLIAPITVLAWDGRSVPGFESIRERPRVVLLAAAFVIAYSLLWWLQLSHLGRISVNCGTAPESCFSPLALENFLRPEMVQIPIFEEFVYRGIGYTGFRIAFGETLALICTTVAFAAIHMLYGNFVWLHVVAGVGYGLLFWYGRSIALNIATHSALNGVTMMIGVIRWNAYWT